MSNTRALVKLGQYMMQHASNFKCDATFNNWARVGQALTELDSVFAPQLGEFPEADQLVVREAAAVMMGKRDPSKDGMGSTWNAKFNPNRMTMAKVNEKIDWINTSLQMNIGREVRSRALRAVIGANGTVDTMAGLLRFIRQEMGLT